MKPQQKAAPGGTGAAENNTSELSSHSTPSLCRQARRVLDLLRAGPLSTCDLIAAGILRPGARVFDLRCAGFDVATERRSEVDTWGRPHPKTARYHLNAGRVSP